jgi:apolipoprotein D and lipocalin family protein
MALAFCSVGLAAAPGGSLRAVDSLDLNRYVGKWYEVARLPNWFQRKCAADTTATYTLRPNGSISVLNQCRMADGRIDQITGTAKRASEDGPNAKLRVSFFWPFYGDYWVIDLDAQYQWAVVGEPRRRYLWVLSRNPSLDKKTLDGILDRVRAQGYDLSSLMISSR